MKKLFTALMVLAVLSAAAFADAPFHIGVVTGTVSQSEDDLRGAEALIAEYGTVADGGYIQHMTYPDNFMEEQETTISVIAGLADDPLMKAVIVNQAVPGTAEAFRQIKDKFGSSFIAGISGGGSMSKDVDDFFSAIGVKLLNGYGMTETAPVIGVQSYPHAVRGFMHPFAGTELKVISTEDGHVLPPGEKGELLVRGPQVMKGYYKDPERTARIIDSEGFLHTGDLAILEYRGDFAIVGRVKDTIVLSGGENIEPVPIEAALQELPAELRQAVTLREIDGLSYEDIALIMKTPLGTVRSRIFRARQFIEERLAQLAGGK